MASLNYLICYQLTAIWTEDIADTPKINFDSIISNIEELNQLAGEGVGKVQKTVGGARLKVRYG